MVRYEYCSENKRKSSECPKKAFDFQEAWGTIADHFKKIHGPQAPKEMKDGTRLLHGTVPFLKMGVAVLFQHQYLLQHSCGQN